MTNSSMARAARAIEQSAGREAVIRAAAQVFMERGYTATTMDDVARVIGATKGWVYHYYRSKAALFADVHELALITITARVRRAFDGEGTADEKFHAMCVEHVRTMIDEFALCRVGSIHGLERNLAEDRKPQQARLLRKITKLRDEFEGMFAEVIEDGIRTGVFASASPHVAVKAAMGSLNWFGVWFDPTRKTTESTLASITNTLAAFATNGLRPVKS